MLRPLAAIDKDIAAAEARLAELQRERADTVASEERRQREGVVKAFDDGASRKQLMEAFGLTYEQVARILHRAGRSERQRRAIGLRPRQLADYQRLIRTGVSSRIARQIAETVSA